jgi:rfaE bifunctional protein nucleotidyltransferase chain/domain
MPVSALAQCDAWREAGWRVVMTNGHFDLLHLGHVDYLQRARDLGDALVVAVNSDASTRALKGPQRPLVPAVERAQMLGALGCVDLVVVFDALTAESLVAALRPAVYVKGGDWDPAGAAPAVRQTSSPRREPPEAAIVAGYGGDVRYLPYLAGHSTRELIALIVARYAPGAASSREAAGL